MKNKLMSLLCGLVLFSGIAEAGTAIHYYAPNDPANLLVVNTNFENVVGRLDAIYPDATTGLGSWLYLWTNDIRGIDNLIGVGSGYITNFSELYINGTNVMNAISSGGGSGTNIYDQLTGTNFTTEDISVSAQDFLFHGSGTGVVQSITITPNQTDNALEAGRLQVLSANSPDGADIVLESGTNGTVEIKTRTYAGAGSVSLDMQPNSDAGPRIAITAGDLYMEGDIVMAGSTPSITSLSTNTLLVGGGTTTVQGAFANFHGASGSGSGSIDMNLADKFGSEFVINNDGGTEIFGVANNGALNITSGTTPKYNGNPLLTNDQFNTFSISAQILNPTSSIPDNLIVFEQGSSEAYTITNLTGSAMVSGEVTANFWTANPTNILGNHTINYTGLVFNTVYTNVVVNIPVSAGFRSGWDITANNNATGWVSSAGAYRQ